MEQGTFLQLLEGLRSEDNELRRNAEASYENLSTTQPGWTMHALVEVCATQKNPGTVTMGLILLRKLFGSNVTCFEATDEATQAAVKGRMLQVFANSVAGAQRGSAVACVSALAAKVWGMQQEWDGLWGSIREALTSNDASPELKAACCDVLATTAPTMIHMFEGSMGALKTGLLACVKSENVATVESAFSAMSALAACSETAAAQLADLVPFLVEAVQRQLNAAQWENAAALCSILAQCVESSPGLFSKHTGQLLAAMMEVASQPLVPKSTRHMALEAMLTYCEGDAKAIRRIPDFMESLFKLLFEYTLHPTEQMGSETWDTTDGSEVPEDLDGVTDQDAGSSGLDRMAMSLGGRKLQKVVYELFTQNVMSPEWERRNAAVLLILYIGEGMHAVLNSNLDKIVEAATALTKDTVKYVRASALSCLGQLGADFNPDFQDDYHAAVVPALIACVTDSVPRVASVAADAISEFFDNIGEDDDEVSDMEVFSQYIPLLCEKLVTLLKSSPYSFVRESCLAALSSVTSSCKKALSPYVKPLAETYQQIMQMEDGAVSVKEKCVAIECMTLLACGVGKELFAPYASGVCEFLQGMLQSGMKNDDMRMRYILRGWTCMVECLEADVLPYMQSVLPYLVNVMNTECDTIVEQAEVGDENESEDDEDGVERMRLVIPGKGTVVAKYHTALIEDKSLASVVVLAILTTLRGSIAAHLPLIAESAIKLLEFQASSDIRDSGALILDVLVSSVAEVNVQEAAGVVQHVLPKLLQAVAEESDVTVTSNMVKAIGQCVQTAPVSVSTETAQLIAEKLFGVVEASNERRGEALANRNASNDEDERDELEGAISTEEELLNDVCETICVLLQRTGEVFAPVFENRFLPMTWNWIVTPRDEFDVTKGFALLSEFVLCTPAQMMKSAPDITSHVLSYASHTTNDPDSLQACFYCMNVLLTKLRALGYPAFAPFCMNAVTAVTTYLETPAVGDEEHEHCTCNVVSAGVTILDESSADLSVPVATHLLQAVSRFLPVKGDEVEARAVHGKVMAWLTNGHHVLSLAPGVEEALTAALQSADPSTLPGSKTA